MPKSRPATWLEKEMMLNLIKKSGKKLDVDLDKCDYIRSSAGNLVCMFEDQPVFYVTKGCRLAMPPRPKKIKTSLRNKNLKKLAKKDAKKKAAHEKQVEKQREKMAQIAKTRQVICITHLAQLASMADTHYLIEKTVENDETRTRVHRLDETARQKEVARLLGGEGESGHGMLHAGELIEKAKAYKNSL